MKTSMVILFTFLVGITVAGSIRSCAEMPVTESGVTILRSGAEQ